jgi:hypothetical protein
MRSLQPYLFWEEERVSWCREHTQRGWRGTLVRNGTLREQLAGAGGNTSSHSLQNLRHDKETGGAAAREGKGQRRRREARVIAERTGLRET